MWLDIKILKIIPIQKELYSSTLRLAENAESYPLHLNTLCSQRKISATSVNGFLKGGKLKRSLKVKSESPTEQRAPSNEHRATRGLYRLYRNLYCFNHACLVRLSLPGDLKGCTMINRGPEERKADCNIYSAVKTQEL